MTPPRAKPTARRPGGAADRILALGVRRLEESGLTVGLDHLGMEDLIREAGVSRATAYRRWPRREDFVADVLVETVWRTSLIPETEADISAVLTVVGRHGDRLTSEQGRRDLVVEALRVAADADVRRILGSPRWSTYLALVATYRTLPDDAAREAVGTALAQAEAAFAARRAEIYTRLCELIGYRPLAGADPAAYAELGAAAGTVMTGIVVGALARPSVLDERSDAALFGASQPAPWSAPERLLVGLLLAHLAPDPGVSWSPDVVAERLALFGERLRELYEATTAPPSRRDSGCAPPRPDVP